MATKFDTFVTNLKYITESNAKRNSPHSALLGLTNFADLSFMEFKETYMTMNSDNMDIVNDDVDELTFSCCWAFSTVAAIEGIVAIKTKKLISLSDQELLDCEPYGNCLRGNVNKAFIWVEGNKGIATQDRYPYTANKGVCRNSTIPNSATSRIKSHHLVKRSENGLLCSVAKQPLNVGIYAETREFQHYTGGVFRGQECPLDSMDVTHSMVIVGYDSVDNDKYWIVKNSVGTKWGKNGYMFIKRETGKKYGVCAINAWAIEIVKNK
ncbi:cysteine protease XCP2-like [Vicia villosa]|uniref:cysteine protease XCP2-like n=1 Tax=Vicia villosa TaxID=3911 RepID=UPI00273BCD60|nr:cysteine protease XCP2-like [Vicia villosa]